MAEFIVRVEVIRTEIIAVRLTARSANAAMNIAKKDQVGHGATVLSNNVQVNVQTVRQVAE